MAAKAWEGSQSLRKQVSSGTNTPHLPGAPLQELTVLNLTSSDANKSQRSAEVARGGGGNTARPVFLFFQKGT